jgi:ankyrin repeat protein
MTKSAGSLSFDLQERLYKVARDGSGESIRALMKEGGNVTTNVVLPDPNGLAALQYAAYYGNVDTMRVLLELGGKAHARTKPKRKSNKKTCQIQSCQTALSNTELFDLGQTLKGSPANAVTPVHMAACFGHIETLGVLLKTSGGNVKDLRDGDGWTPLHRAVAIGHLEAVRLLLEANAEVNLGNTEGRTPVHTAAIWGRTEVMTMLAEAGADFNVVDKRKRTPLHFAAGNVDVGHVETVRTLLVNGKTYVCSCRMARHRYILLRNRATRT